MLVILVLFPVGFGSLEAGLFAERNQGCTKLFFVLVAGRLGDRYSRKERH